MSEQNQHTAIDNIIREIQPVSKREAAGRNIYIIDAKTGEFLEFGFQFFQKQRKFFEIDPHGIALDVKGPEIAVGYSNSINPFVVEVKYQARLADKGVYKLIKSVYKKASVVEAINERIRSTVEKFVFEHPDFVVQFNKYKSTIEANISTTCLLCGLTITPVVTPKIAGGEPSPFINCDHKMMVKTRDGQSVEIFHFFTLTLRDPLKAKLSGIRNVEQWAKNKLEQFTFNAIIESNYAEVLVSVPVDKIRDPMEEASEEIGYELKQLSSTQGLEIEKFYFETDDGSPGAVSDYRTKDPSLRIALNIVVNGRLDLQSRKTQQYIKPQMDIIEGLRKNVIEYARVFINGITPEDCFTKAGSFESDLENHLRNKLNESYGFRDISVVIKFLENDLAQRILKLGENPKKVELYAEWEQRKYNFWFKVWGVTPDGWNRFRRNNYRSTEEELDAVALMVKNGMEADILRTEADITGDVIGNAFWKVRNSVAREFGLNIKIFDFNEGLSEEEQTMIAARKKKNEEDLKRLTMLDENETNELAIYLEKRRIAIGSGEEDDEVIKKLDEKIKSFRSKSTPSTKKFLKKKTDNRFLTEPDKDMPDQDQSDK